MSLQTYLFNCLFRTATQVIYNWIINMNLKKYKLYRYKFHLLFKFDINQIFDRKKNKLQEFKL